jgi:hypothetical protein
VTFKLEQEGPKTSSMSYLVTMLQRKFVLRFSPELLSCLIVLK